jgi:hypothetical protein
MLFEEQEPTAATFTSSEPREESGDDWSLLKGDVEDFLPGAPVGGPPPAAAGNHAAAPEPPAAAATGDHRLWQPVEAAEPPRKEPRPQPKVVRPVRTLPAQPRGGPATMLIPAIVFSSGLGVGGYAHLVGDNPVLGGVAASLGLVGSLFAWVLFRR